ncbi:type VII secretion integral membrane protein EccD [Hoyosella rhizosphaerae]|uniref:EccD-like transmembrane domain-containing protein n=1 Tax=Hoyosella rhizosphaerae TaxID=1755582 RepID=A0A916U9P4_9ACTN|nr:type VII secretion integral membrane protein EccD [Hoyosella rhizosphaerae]MBN4926177.1 type VII secretion integral membrane protein EccD [Hoyosella rhizosphaerae]GGC64903.1 hypothetical protein GCM10011410_16760 [Hoyosella rhizosphaerae]
MDHTTGELSQNADTQALCHVCVVGSTRQVDLALPETVPLVLLIPRLVEIIYSEKSQGANDPNSGWSLSRIGDDPLDLNHSLSRLGIKNGELLLLSPIEQTPPGALVDDVIDAVASYSPNKTENWSSGRSLPLTNLFMIAAALIAAATLIGATAGTHLALAGVALMSIPALIVVASVYARTRSDWAATVMILTTIPLTAGITAQLVPGAFGGPHVLIVAAYALCLTAITARVIPTTAHVHATVGALAATIVVGAALTIGVGFEPSQLALGIILISPFAVSAAPRIAVAITRLPLPPVPSPGSSLALADIAPDTAHGSSNPYAPAKYIRDRTAITHKHLDGILTAVMLLASVSAAYVAWNLHTSESQPETLATVFLTGCVAIALLLRGRGIARTVPSLIVSSGGAAVALSTLIAAELAPHIPAWVALTIALGALAGAVIVGVVIPGGNYSPLQYRLVELTEYLALALVVPFGLWALDLYSYVRGM